MGKKDQGAALRTQAVITPALPSRMVCLHRNSLTQATYLEAYHGWRYRYLLRHPGEIGHTQHFFPSNGPPTG